MMFDDDDLEQDRLKWYEARVAALEAELARCRSANVYDGGAHRRVAALEAALQWIAMANSSLHGYDDLRTRARIALDLAALRAGDGECQACGGKGCKHCDARAGEAAQSDTEGVKHEPS